MAHQKAMKNTRVQLLGMIKAQREECLCRITGKEVGRVTQKQYKNDIIKKMKALNLYRPEFGHAIDGLARALCDLEKTTEMFEKSGGQIIIKHTNKAGATNAIKNPFYQAVEILRQDILAYSRELGLTPASIKRIKEEELRKKKDSPLAAALQELSK